MVQQPSIPNDLPTDFNHVVVLFPTASDPEVPPAHTAPAPVQPPAALAGPAGPASQPGRRHVPVRTRAIRDVAVLTVACPMGEVAEELDGAIQLALAEGRRAVVCDLSAVLEAEPGAVGVLATAGRHVRDWPGVPVAVACPDPRVREALRAHPLGRHLTVTASLFSALSAVRGAPSLTIQQLTLAPHPTASRAAREFVTRTLLDLGLGRVIPFASLAVSELVASSAASAGTHVDVSVVWNLGAVRVAVRDHGPGLPDQQTSTPDLHGRRLTVVAGLSRAFGVLPTADGGQVVWAVLDAPLSRSSTSPNDSAAARQEALILSHARTLASCLSSHPRVHARPETQRHALGVLDRDVGPSSE